MKTLIIAPHPVLVRNADRLEWCGACLLWTGRVRKNGYPEVNVKVDGKWVTKKVSRIVCEEAHGPLGLLSARHICGHTRCVLPAHLVPGTHQQNMDDKKEHGTDNIGIRNPMSRLSPLLVDEIRKRLKQKPRPTQDVLALEFGVVRQTISKIARGERWS